MNKKKVFIDVRSVLGNLLVGGVTLSNRNIYYRSRAWKCSHIKSFSWHLLWQSSVPWRWPFYVKTASWGNILCWPGRKC